MYKIEGTSSISDDDISIELKNLLDTIKNNLVNEYPTVVISVEYFILAAMSMKNNFVSMILEDSISSFIYDKIASAFEQQVSQRALGIVKPGRITSFSKEFSEIVLKGDEERKKLSDGTLSSIHIFLALLSNESNQEKIRSVFKSSGVTYDSVLSKWFKIKENDNTIQPKDSVTFEIPKPQNFKILFDKAIGSDMTTFSLMQNMMGNPFFEPNDPKKTKGKKMNQKQTYISQYCTNLNELAELGKIDQIIGRENENEEIIRVLGRRRKNSAILVGNDGCGKTAIAENLAYKIINKEVPEFLRDKTVVSLDMTALMAGTTLRGMFEERVKGLLTEIKTTGKYILMIDNIGNVLSSKSNANNDYDISSMLSESLDKGEVQILGTSGYKAFRSTFDKDPSLSRKFQKIQVDSPTVNESIEILNGIKKYYEEFHGVIYTDNAIEDCVKLANRYIAERNLPDSAIDVMDESGSYIGKKVEYSEDIKKMRSDIEAFEKEAENYRNHGMFNEADMLVKQSNDLSRQLNGQIRKECEERKSNSPIVDENTILEIVSKKTGIPVNKLSSDDKKRLSTIDKRLKEVVIGQDDAIDIITRSLKRNRIGLHNNGCMCSFLMIGKSGVGKTLIAKKLAQEIFGDEKAILRFDMSEYPDKTAVNKLIGSNPGYVGYEEGGQLTESVKNRKHCVLLLDEIEKADPEVYNIFLQVLDEGFLTDNSGMKVDFKNVIVLFTSNIGTKAANDFGRGISFNDDETENTKKILSKELKNRFPPEFINRLDDVIYFNSLTEDNLRQIIKIEIGKMIDNVKSIGYDCSYDENIVSKILNIISDEKDYGARPIVRTIRTEIEDKITDLLLESDYKKGYCFNVKYDENEDNINVK